MPAAPFDEPTAHRWFAVEFNNQAWELVERSEISPDEVDAMVHLAHATCIHWLSVGSIVNQVRGQSLLATVYSKAGFGEAAVRHAEKCIQLSEVADDQTTPFDRAVVHGAAANAYACRGDFVRAREQHLIAMAAAKGIEDSDDLALLGRLYPPPTSHAEI